MRFVLLFVIMFLISCGKSKDTKIAIPKDNNSERMKLEKDSTLIEIADIPIHIDSTHFLIHPIGEYKIYGSRGRINFGSYGYSNSRSFRISSFNRYEIKGDLLNLKFEDLNTDNISTLTSNNIRLESITFLRDLFDNKKEQYLAYKVIDQDTNLDHKIDNNDVKSLYISNIDGSNFIKLTKELHELIDWKFIGVNNKLYFRSIEDSNKNGEFDKKDQIHYQFVDFNKPTKVVENYYPIH